MRRLTPEVQICAGVFAALLGLAQARAQGPHLGYVCPAGGRQGETVRVAVGGQQLRDATGAVITGKGVAAEVVEFVYMLDPRQRMSLARTLAALERARPTIEVVDAIADMRRQLATHRPESPALADTVIVEVTIAPDAAPGRRELRLLTRSGLTNPLVFRVGALPETTEGAMPEVPWDVQVLRALGEPEPLPEPRLDGPVDVELPAVVNGQILPGSTDRYRFRARRGQRIVLAVQARSLIPYIADGVPGWFEAAARVCDAHGRELAYADHFRFHPDPVLCVDIPEDGEYVAEVRDSIYRGREDFVYRIAIGEFPFVTGVFPLGCRPGERVKLEVTGWNLPVKRIAFDAGPLSAGTHMLSLLQDAPACNRVAFEVSELPETDEARAHGSEKRAQKLTLPVVVNGRIDSPGQWDVYRFKAVAGQELVAQVRARRLGSPLDSVLILTDGRGRHVAECDDCGDNKDAGLETHHADSSLRVRLAEAGWYYLHLGDIQQRGGPEYAYRLRLGAPRPDFDLRVTPSAVDLRPGENVPVAVHAVRKDGFDGAIDLCLESPGSGVSASGTRVGAGQSSVLMTLSALPSAEQGRVLLTLRGRAVIDGREVWRDAVPAEDMMQAFLWRHLVPAQDFSANILPAEAPARWIRVEGDLPLSIPAGASASVRVKVSGPNVGNGGPVQFELIDPPEGIGVRTSHEPGAGARMVVVCESDAARPGLTGNLLASAFVMVTPAPGAAARFRPRPLPADWIVSPDKAPRVPDRRLMVAQKPNREIELLVLDLDLDGRETEMRKAPRRTVPEQPPAGSLSPWKMTIGMLPAIPFEIVDRQ